MKLKAVLDSLEGLDKAFHQFYTERAGKFFLDLEGVPEGFVEKTKLDEFRENNIKLLKQLEDAGKKRSLTPEEEAEFSRLKKLEVDQRDKKLISEGKIEELLEARTSTMRQDYDGQITSLRAAKEKAEQLAVARTNALSATLITAELGKAVSQVGNVRKGAIDDLMNRARGTWKFGEDMSLRPMEGDQVIYGKDAKTPITMVEWVQGLAEKAPHLFEGSQGGGSSGGGDNKGGKVIEMGDNKGFIANLADIAGGKVQVRAPAGT